jgi:hypothetical protein
VDTYGIFLGYVEQTINGETVSINICPDNARKNIAGDKWICNDPQYSPPGVEPLQTLTYEQALELMDTAEWKGAE